MTNTTLINSRATIEKQIAICEKLLSECNDDAQKVADDYWAFRKLMNRRHCNSQSKIGVRVRGRSIEWFVNKFTRDDKGDYHVYSTHVRKGLGYSYSLKKLEKLAQQWEVDAILAAEIQFAKIREKNAILIDIRRSLKKLQKICH